MTKVRINPVRGLRRRAQRGVALLEALLAVVLLAIGLMGTLALQARSLAALSETSMRVEATIAANELVGMVNSDYDNRNAYALAQGAAPGPLLAVWHAELVKRIPGASVQVSLTPTVAAALGSTSDIDIIISWQRTPDSQLNRQRIVSYVSQAR